MNGLDWLLLTITGILCAAYCSAGYIVGHQYRNGDDAELLRRLAKASRDAGYASLTMNRNRKQLLADADAAEEWADTLASRSTIDKPVDS